MELPYLHCNPKTTRSTNLVPNVLTLHQLSKVKRRIILDAGLFIASNINKNEWK